MLKPVKMTGVQTDNRNQNSIITFSMLPAF